MNHSRRNVLCLFAAALAAPAMAEVSGMNDYLWRNRPLLVFVPDAAHPLLAEQRAALAGAAAGLQDREMVVIEIAGDGVRVDGRAAPGLSASSLRGRFGVPAGSAQALLVGKDGGVKLRQPHAYSTETLFETIDAMPMRRQEMRTRAAGGN